MSEWGRVSECDMLCLISVFRYDVGMSSAILPMVNAHEVYPTWDENMHEAYEHLCKRLQPSWAVDEPVEVVNACQQFVDGYRVLFRTDDS